MARPSEGKAKTSSRTERDESSGKNGKAERRLERTMKTIMKRAL